MGHKFGDYRYLELFGRERKRARENPTRWRQRVRKALAFLRIRYKEVCMFRNPLYHGGKSQKPNSPQLLEFVILIGGHLAAILIPPGAWHKREQASLDAKLSHLESKSIPYIVLSTRHTYMEDVIIIDRWRRNILRGAYRNERKTI